MYLDTRATQATSGKTWYDAKQLREIANEIRGELGRIYRLLDKLDARAAELDGPADLPKPRNRTAVQQRVSKCPRCGDRSAA